MLSPLPVPACWCSWSTAQVVAAYYLVVSAVSYRLHWAVPKVSREADRRAHGLLRVSSCLQLSSPGLQERYYRWLDERCSFVKLQPWVNLATPIGCHAQLMLKAAQGCGLLHQALLLPATVLSAGVLGRLWVTSKQDQSAIYFCREVYVAGIFLVLMAQGDRCIVSIGPGWTSIQWVGVYAAFLALHPLVIPPYTTKHLDVAFFTLGTGLSVFIYMQYLQLTGGFHDMSSSDPQGEVCLAIASWVFSVCAAVYVLRYKIASARMMEFLQHVRPRCQGSQAMPPRALAGVGRILKLAQDGPAFANVRATGGPLNFFAWATAFLCAAILAAHNIWYGAGALLALCAVFYRVYQIVPKVVREAGFLLHVSPCLLLYTPRLQEHYYRWLEANQPFAKLGIFASLAANISYHFLLLNLPQGCGLVDQAVHLPATALVVACVVMDLMGAQKQHQSAVHLCRMAIMLTSQAAMSLRGSRCAATLIQWWVSGQWAGFSAAALTALALLSTPCTTRHLDALCCMVGAGLSTILYLAAGDSDPEAPAITFGVLTTCAIFYAVRYRIASTWLISFMDSVRSGR